MSPLETALIILVSIWSIIFLIIAVALILIFRQIKKGLDTVNHILEKADDVTTEIGAPLKMLGAGASGLLGKVGISAFKKFTKKNNAAKK